MNGKGIGLGPYAAALYTNVEDSMVLPQYSLPTSVMTVFSHWVQSSLVKPVRRFTSQLGALNES